MIKTPRTFSPQEKAQVALAAIKGDKTIAQISSGYQVHPTQISGWKKQAVDNLSEIFKDTRKKERQKEFDHQTELDNLHKLIGQRDVEFDWLKKNYQYLTHSEPVGLIDKNNKEINLVKQAELLGISRSSIYYQPIGISAEDKIIMNLIDEIYTAHPFYGNRKIKAELNLTHHIQTIRGH